jgi:5-methylcytosine-specific restriction endonuclease McrA
MSKSSCKGCVRVLKKSTLDKNEGFCGRCFKKSKKYVKKAIPSKLRQLVWEINIGNKLYGNCFTCNMRLSSFEFAAGHIHSEATGGPTVQENLKVVCKSCNSKMGTQNMMEFKKIRYPDDNVLKEHYSTFKIINRRRMLFEL